MAASSSKNTTPTSDTPPISEKPKVYDFAFVLKPAKILKNAIEALSDRKLNPDQEALIKVGPRGCDISIWNVDMITANQVFAMLQLKADGLDEFQCTKPFKKMLPLKTVYQVLRAANDYDPNAESVAVFVEAGSREISFQWGKSVLDFALGQPVHIEFQNAEKEYDEFPNTSYTGEFTVPSADFTSMLTRVPVSDDILCRDNLVEMALPENYKIQMELSFSESLKSASKLSENLSVYLITIPHRSIMLGFKLGQVGIMAYMNDAEFISVPKLPIIGHFRPLHPRDDQL